MTTPEEDIQTNSQKPKRATIDGNTVEQHSIRDQIEADRYKRSIDGVKRANRGFIMTRVSSPGTAEE